MLKRPSMLDLGDIFSLVVYAGDIANKSLCLGFLKYAMVDTSDWEEFIYFPVALN